MVRDRGNARGFVDGDKIGGPYENCRTRGFGTRRSDLDDVPVANGFRRRADTAPAQEYPPIGDGMFVRTRAQEDLANGFTVPGTCDPSHPRTHSRPRASVRSRSSQLLDRASVAIDPKDVADPNRARRPDDVDHAWNPELARNHRRVRQRATELRDHPGSHEKKRCPPHVGRMHNQDFTRLKLVHLILSE